MPEFVKKHDEEKPWYEQSWAGKRRLVIRPDVPGADYYPPDFSHLFDTEEKRENFRTAMDVVLEAARSEEGPLWARGLTDEELSQSLDLDTLLDDFESGRLEERYNGGDGFTMRFDETAEVDN